VDVDRHRSPRPRWLDELGGAVRECEVAQLVEHQKLGAGVFADDA
jgi:hypothetical protein